MNITHLLFNMKIGGTETMLIDILNRQAADGHNVSLILINDVQDEALIATISPKVRIVRMNRRLGSKNPLWLLRMRRAIASTAPDVVHSHNVMALGLVRGPRRYPLCFTLHTTGIGRPDLIRRADQLFSISQAVADELRERLGLDSTVVPNGIVTSSIRRRDAGSPAPADTLRIVQTGRLDHTVKGQDITLRALALLRTMLPDKRIEVDFIGSGQSLDYLKGLAAELGVADSVRFLGDMSRNELYSRLADYQLSLLPSRQEGFGLTLAETLAAGVPSISSDLPGPTEVLAGGRYGRIFPAGDHQALAREIAAAAADYPAEQSRALEGAAYVAGKFDIAATARLYVSEYLRSR